MDVFSATPLSAGSVVWQSLPGQWTLTVVCKATYELRPGTSPLGAESEAIVDGDAYWDDDADRSVYAPSDLAPLKPRPEVMLVGSAYSPRKEPTRSLVVRLRVGLVDKAVEVVVPRTIMADGTIREGAPWKQMPLLYERAAGGPHTWNPLGMSRDTVDRHGRRSLPNLQPPGLGIATAENVEPVGFGPISSAWSIRRERLGIRETSWSDREWAQNPLGAGFDAAYFQCAPADQWLDQIHPDEALTLENLHPEHALLTTRLAGAAPRARVETLGDPAWDLDMVADTLWIDTNRSVCTLTWRAQLRLESPEQQGKVVIGIEEKGQAVRWPSVPKSGASAKSARPRMPEVDALVNTADEEEAAAALGAIGGGSEVLPFRSAPASMAGPRPRTAEIGPKAWVDGGTQAAPSAFGGAPAAMPSWLASSSEAPPPSRVAPPPPVSTILGPRGGSGTMEVPAARFGAADVSNAAAAAPPGSGIGRGPKPLGSTIGIEAVNRAKTHDRTPPSASFGSLLQASNAAADAPSARANAPREAAVAATPIRSEPSTRSLSELLWFDPAAVDRIRAKEDWSEFAVRPTPDEDEKKAAEEKARADRATVVAVLARARSVHDVDAELHGAVDDDGLFVPPIGVVGGELETPFDEVETLKILAGAAGPLAPGDKRLKEVLDLADEVTKTPLGSSADVAASFVARIREAWAKEKRMLPADYLDLHARRLLLEQRLYQKRQLADAEWIRALLTPPNASTAIPAYLPVAMGRWLPLFARFPARVIASIVPQQDQAESSPVALYVSALSRTSPGRRR